MGLIFRRELKKIEKKYKGKIKNITDLIGNKKPSKLFFFLANHFDYLLDDDENKILSKKSMERRDKINKIIKKYGSKFLKSKQVFEDRNKLKYYNYQELLKMGKKVDFDKKLLEKDSGIDLSKEENVIWVANHGFKDDALATVLSANKNAYILFGSLPQFYNTFDGIISWINGVILINRKMTSSKEASIRKCIKALQMNKDIIIYSEGVWNKSSNKLVLHLWPGIYKIAKETNTRVVPIIHYKKELHETNKKDIIHTVIDNPIDLTKYSEKEALIYLRDRMAYWTYLMMQKYGKTTRKELLKGNDNSTSAWEEQLNKRIQTVDYYDPEIEKTAHYQTKEEREYYEILNDISNIKNINPYNIHNIIKAKELLRDDFQRRY